MNLSRQPVLDCQRASRLTGNRVIPARARPPGAAGQVSTERHGNLPVRPGTSPDGGSRPCAGPGGTVPVADRRGRSALPRRAAARCHGRQCWCSRWPGPLPASRCGRRGALVPGSGALPRRSGPGAVSGRDARRSSRAVRRSPPRRPRWTLVGRFLNLPPIPQIPEILVQQALWRLMEGRTALVVAHRLSTQIREIGRDASAVAARDAGKVPAWLPHR